MKMDVISRTGRKKDFWDIHQLLENLTVSEMIALHAERYSYLHSEDELRQKLLDFSFADDDFAPICLKGKYWELIKEDIREAVIITQK